MDTVATDTVATDTAATDTVATDMGTDITMVMVTGITMAIITGIGITAMPPGTGMDGTTTITIGDGLVRHDDAWSGRSKSLSRLLLLHPTGQRGTPTAPSHGCYGNNWAKPPGSTPDLSNRGKGT